MTTTIVASVVIPLGPDPKPVATIVAPHGEVMRVVLYDHDWSHDWNRDGRAPASLYRHLLGITGERIPHGDRKVYESPRDLSGRDDYNATGQLTVWEIDYDTWEA